LTRTHTHTRVEIKKLLRKQDKDRRTPLVYALIRRNTPITKLLIAKKANINFANPEEVPLPPPPRLPPHCETPMAHARAIARVGHR